MTAVFREALRWRSSKQADFCSRLMPARRIHCIHSGTLRWRQRGDRMAPLRWGARDRPGPPLLASGPPGTYRGPAADEEGERRGRRRARHVATMDFATGVITLLAARSAEPAAPLSWTLVEVAARLGPLQHSLNRCHEIPGRL